MKISNVEIIDGVYHLTKKPYWFERIFGIKTKVIRYKPTGNVFHYFPDILVFIREDGDIASPVDDECRALNKCYRKKQNGF